ncbi:MAG: hypothetical protein R3B09_21075 [Nannocystaceae bacterium]
MTGARAWIERIVVVALGVVALGLGLVVGAPGCILCQCPDVDPFEPGTFEIVESPERPELVGGILAASDDGVEISYSLEDGSEWVVTYAIEAKAPEE